MSDLEFIQKTPSDELYKHHLEVVFKTYHQLFGEVCTGCPTEIAGYINRIKNFKKSDIMSQTKSKFILRGQSVIVIGGTSQVYSNANLTDEVAIAFIKKNVNRKALFAKLPNNLEELLSGDSASSEKALKDHTIAELKVIYPEAAGRTKTALLADIQAKINEAAANAEAEEAEAEEAEKNLQIASDEEE